MVIALGENTFSKLPVPPIGGALLMLAAGVTWSAHWLLSRNAVDPLAGTAGNFLRALPWRWRWRRLHDLLRGFAWTVAAQRASVQLSVPLITALAGTIALGEAITIRLSLSSIAILGGIALVFARRPRAR